MTFERNGSRNMYLRYKSNKVLQGTWNVENRRITIREVAEDVGISIGSCHSIFSNVLGMKNMTAKFVPKLLNFEHKQCHISIAQELLNDINNEPGLLKWLIWLPATFSYSQNWRNQWKESVLPQLMRSSQNRRKSWWPYRKAHFRSATRIGKSVGASVLYPRGIALKGGKIDIDE